MAGRKADWARLGALSDKAGQSLRRLSGDELAEFLTLYRRASGDLARARTRDASPHVTDGLNAVVARAYSLLHRPVRPSAGRAVGNGLAISTSAVRRRWRAVAFSGTLLLGSVVGTYFLTGAVPGVRAFLVPPGMESSFESWVSGSFEARTGAENLSMAGFYASNNPFQAVLTGALGAGTFGLLSLFLIVKNGALIGILAHAVAERGRLDYLLSSLAPHGVPELGGLVISGAAGLVLGGAALVPGRESRGESLRRAGPDAIALLATGVLLMFVAAPIEAFFSFSPFVPGFLKTTVAILSLAAWATFFTRYRASSEE